MPSGVGTSGAFTPSKYLSTIHCGWVGAARSDASRRSAPSLVAALPVITPLTFLGGTFYSIDALPPAWQTVSLFNPVVYLVSGFRWSFYEISDVNVGLSLAMTFAFLLACLAAVWWIFRTGYRLKA